MSRGWDWNMVYVTLRWDTSLHIGCSMVSHWRRYPSRGLPPRAWRKRIQETCCIGTTGILASWSLFVVINVSCGRKCGGNSESGVALNVGYRCWWPRRPFVRPPTRRILSWPESILTFDLQIPNQRSLFPWPSIPGLIKLVVARMLCPTGSRCSQWRAGNPMQGTKTTSLSSTMVWNQTWSWRNSNACILWTSGISAIFNVSTNRKNDQILPPRSTISQGNWA